MVGFLRLYLIRLVIMSPSLLMDYYGCHKLCFSLSSVRYVFEETGTLNRSLLLFLAFIMRVVFISSFMAFVICHRVDSFSSHFLVSTMYKFVYHRPSNYRSYVIFTIRISIIGLYRHLLYMRTECRGEPLLLESFLIKNLLSMSVRIHTMRNFKELISPETVGAENFL